MTAGVRECVVSGCTKAGRSRQMCIAHYTRWRRGASLDTPVRGSLTLSERLERDSYYEPNSGCILWGSAGTTDACGYGRIKWQGRSVRVHRLAWSLAYGDVPGDRILRHRCDTPACLNVDHLELGTHAENAGDRACRGRSARLVGERNPAAKLTREAVMDMRREYSDGVQTCAELARKYGVSKSVANNAIRGVTWSHI